MNEIVRKLASVRRIESVEVIPDADNIVCATVDGWKLVTQKSNNFQAGDLVVYFEIDSFLPVTEKFEFLRKSSLRVMDNEEGFRLKTIKLRGQVSQGLILPMSEFFETMGDLWIDTSMAGTYSVDEGDDLTEMLGVKKWEPPIHPSLSGKVRGNFPSFIVKTDQERIQNIFKYRNRYVNEEYEVTLKLDGSSMTAYYNEGRAGVCSRNLDLEETAENAFWKVARSSKLIEALEMYGENIAVQGELMGPGIQGNRENLKELTLYIFDIFNINTQEYMPHNLRMDVISDLGKLGCTANIVPIVDFVYMDDIDSLQAFLDYADSVPSINHPIAEGLVFKSMIRKRHSFKVISNKFLLKQKD